MAHRVGCAIDGVVAAGTGHLSAAAAAAAMGAGAAVPASQLAGQTWPAGSADATPGGAGAGAPCPGLRCAIGQPDAGAGRRPRWLYQSLSGAAPAGGHCARAAVTGDGLAQSAGGGIVAVVGTAGAAVHGAPGANGGGSQPASVQYPRAHERSLARYAAWHDDSAASAGAARSAAGGGAGRRGLPQPHHGRIAPGISLNRSAGAVRFHRHCHAGAVSGHGLAGHVAVVPG